MFQVERDRNMRLGLLANMKLSKKKWKQARRLSSMGR
jgi:hypothetical protein